MAISAFKTCLLVGFSLAVSAMLFTAVTEKKAATSWPMWGGTPARNMANTVEKNMPTAWDVQTKKNIKWMVKVGSSCYSNPVVADGKVFVGTNNDSPRNPNIMGDRGVVMCFRQSDGQFLWQAVHDKLPAGRENDWPACGVASTCAVEGKRLYYVSNRCTVVCADTEGFLDGANDGAQTETYHDKADADIVWEFDMMKELGVFPHQLANSSPLIVADLVYALTSNGPDQSQIVLPAPDAPSFIAVNKHTGKLVWQDNSPGDRILDGQWSSPTYGVVNGKGQVYFPGGDGWLYAFEPLGDTENPGKGKIVWKFDGNPPGAKPGFGGRGSANSIVSTAVFHDNRVYIAVGQNPENGAGPGHLYCIDATKTGDVSEHLGEWDPVRRTKVNAKRNANSALVWHYGDKDFGRSISTVAIQDDLIFAADLAGFLHCLDVKTGQPHWQHDMLASVWGSPYVVDNKVYLGDEDGDMRIFEFSKQKKLVHENHLGDSTTGTVVAADGVLYVATKSLLFAIEQK